MLAWVIALALVLSDQVAGLVPPGTGRAVSRRCGVALRGAGEEQTSSGPSPLLGTMVDRRGALGASFAAAALGLSPGVASAFCGEPFPSWAYYIVYNEGLLAFQGPSQSSLDLYLRESGTQDAEKKAQVRPVLLIPGGPGLPHDYFETLEGLVKTDRRVVEFDPIGTGQSTGSGKLTAGDLAFCSTPAGLAAQAATAAEAAGIAKIPHHVVGHGSGALAAILYGAGRKGLVSLTLASPLLGKAPQVADGDSAGYPWAALPPTIRPSLSLDKGRPRACLADAFSGASPAVYNAWAPVPAAEIQEATRQWGPCPTLVTIGDRDLEEVRASTPEACQYAETISGSASGSVKPETFKGCGHFAHLDDRGPYVDRLVEFFDQAETSLKQTGV